MNENLTLSNLNIGFEEVDKYINATSDNIIVCNANEEIIFVNKSFENLTGYKAAEVLGKTPRILKSGKLEEALYIEMWKTLKKGKIFNGSFLNKKKNSELYWIENTIIPMFNNDGELIYYVASGKDITESKKILAELNEEKAKLQMVQQIAEVGFLIWDLKTDEVELSNESLKIFGLTSKNKWVTGNLIRSKVHPKDQEKVQLGLQNAIEQNKEYNIDHRIIKNGEIKWVNAQAHLIKDKNDNPIILMGSVRNITNRKIREEKIKKSEFKLLQAQEISGVGFLDWNLKTNKIEVSKNWLKKFDLTHKNNFLTIELLKKMIHPDHKDLVFNFFMNAVNGEVEFNGDHKMILPSLGTIWVHIDTSCKKNKQGEVKHVIAAIKDITKSKKYEERRLLSANILERLSSIVVSGKSDGTITFVSPSIKNIMGYTIQEMLGDGWWNLTYPNKNESFKTKEKLKRSFENIKGNESNIFLRNTPCKNGEYKWMEWIISKGTENQFFAIGNDVTQRKKSDDKLRELSQALEKSPVSIVITNKEGHIEYVNKHYVDFTGRTIEQVQGKLPGLLQRKNCSLEEYNDRWYTIKSGDIWKGEILSKKNSGDFYWEFVTISPLMNDNNQICNFQFVREDITDKKILEGDFYNSLINSHENEKQKLGENLHEGLAQNLTTMSMYLELLSKNKFLKEEDLDFLKKLKELNKKTISEAVLLSYGIMSKQLKKYGLLYSVKEMCTNLNLQQKIKFSLTIGSIEEGQINNELKLNLFRIIQELTNNVVKHSVANFANITLSLENNKYIKLVILDDGVGFNFSKLKKNKGVGIQNISRRLELLKGKMIRNSSKNEGTIITIKIPLQTYSSSKYFDFEPNKTHF